MLSASETTAALIRENWNQVFDQVTEACVQASRDPTEVRIVGVCKYVGPELAHQLAVAGCEILGENRPQSLWDKYEYCNASPASLNSPTQWHLIGHLQRNKLRRTLPMIRCLHSLDSWRLAQAISVEASEIGMELPVLVEVNITKDPSKTGLAMAELLPFMERSYGLPGLKIRGLMAMSSLGATSDEARAEFEQVRLLRDELQQSLAGQVELSELSMGMSSDFKEAISAGATLVRIGTSLWRGIL